MNSGYVMAGYGLIWVTLLVYAWRVTRRVRTAERELAAVDSRPDGRDARSSLTS